jgi:hypothetical protein
MIKNDNDHIVIANDNDQNPLFPLGQRLGQVATVCQGRDDQPGVTFLKSWAESHW